MCNSIYVHLSRKNNTVGNEGKSQREVACCFSFHPEAWQRKKIKWKQNTLQPQICKLMVEREYQDPVKEFP